MKLDTKQWLIRLALDDDVQRAALQNPAAQEIIRRYVPAKKIEELVPLLPDLIDKGLAISLEYQGIEVSKPADAKANLAGYLRIIETLASAGLADGTELSVRLGWLGIAEHNSRAKLPGRLAKIIAAAEQTGLLVTVGMGTAAEQADTLALWQEAVQSHPKLGITLQSALRNLPSCLEQVVAPQRRIRLVKGVYSEPRRLGYRHQHEIDLSYAKGLRMLFDSPAVPLVATHDPRLISITEVLAKRAGHQFGDHEFQLIYGVRPWEQRRLVDIGHLSRVYIPLGPGWFNYYLTRLADRPANLAIFLRSLLEKR